MTITIRKGSRERTAAPTTWLAAVIAALDEATVAKVFDNVDKAVGVPDLGHGVVGAPVPLCVPGLDLTVRRG